MVDLDMENFEVTLDKFIMVRERRKSHHPDHFSFSGKIGILWLTNHIKPGTEHLVSNIIRQKLIVGIESVTSSVKVNKSVVLFLPEGEYHELGLLHFITCLKAGECRLFTLGSSIPMKDVAYVVNLKKPICSFLILPPWAPNFNFDRFLSNMSKTFPDTPTVISGLLTNTYEKRFTPPFISSSLLLR